ncbi:GATA zinc finger domain-containing protein 1 [Anthonomus grandis grandis]|uniref:GATA zinc finger domain-containing protein 1 n=1 Tax=Anthonomus grandis grandis TaxID=2921223 RepID=UPI00216661F4|nr:GATA zinc finger domain-containing protein 1 [Anthonomus grandis grandis]
MPYKAPIVCLKCESTESALWTNAENLGVICINCVNEAKKGPENEEKEEEEEKPPKKKTRGSRSYKTRHNPNATAKQSVVPRGRGRRSLFKKVPMKAPSSVATIVTSEHVFHKGSYYQIGDIVSVLDESNDCYYAQIIGLMTDQYCKKNAVLQWLLPTAESPPPNEEFDPATYIIGPEEDFPRDLDYMEFIMHAPSDYYKSKKTPYGPVTPTAEPGYIWASMKSIAR